MIRKAVPADIPAIVALGMEGILRGHYPNMVVSREKVEELARTCVSSARHFAWVAEKEGVVGGAVCAVVHECLVYERSQATVVQFYSRIPGEGIKLLRELRRWWHSRPAIKMLTFSVDHDADPRICTLLTRLGLTKVLPQFVATK